MMLTITHLLSFAVGVVFAGAYARRQVVKIKAEALASLYPRHRLSLSPEDIIRRSGV